MSFDRDGTLARLREQDTDALLALLAAHDTNEWEAEVFEIARALLAERGVNVEAALAGMARPGPIDHSPDELEVVATFAMAPDAQPCRSALESAGFDVVLLDENLIGVDPALWPMIKGVKVAVPHSQVEEAREFLAAADRGELSQSPETAIQCPSCGSSNVKFVSSSGHSLATNLTFGVATSPALGGVLALGLPGGPPTGAYYECNDCGAKA
jgi:hypothetical protein